NGTSGDVSVLVGKGDGTFRPASSFAAGSSAEFVAIGDLNGDARPDLAIADNGSYAVAALLGKGDGTFGASTSFASGGSFGLAIGDVNGDGPLDVATANRFTNDV